MIAPPLITALPCAGGLVWKMLNPVPVSLASTLIVTGVPAAVLAASFTAFSPGGLTVAVTVALALWPKLSRMV
ncbi:MAG: hypothetical protein AW12_01922 [Candidatus Accumulibacter sp. BA-94]|nr:MAG: hypothetical protein AW12_01922 [Candidatus Accumulibacter sp. BA-94]